MCTTTKGQQTDPFTLPYPVFNPLSLFLNHPLSLSHKYSTPLFSKRQIRNWSSCHLLGINSFYFFKIHHFSDLLANEAGLSNKNKKSDQAISLLPEDSSNTHCHLCLQSHLIINWYHALNRSLSNREWLTLVYTENEGSIPNPKLPFKTIRQMPLFQGQNAECRGHWAGKSRHQYLSVLVLHWLLSQHSPNTSDSTIYIYMHIHIYFEVFEAVSCTTGYSWTHYMAKDILQLLISCLWVYRPTSPCLVLSSARDQIQGLMHAR